MLVTMLIVVAILAMGGVAVMGVERGLGSAAHERFRSMSLFAAESGVSAGLNHLRTEVSDATNWSSLVTPNNDSVIIPPEIQGNDKKHGETGNLFDTPVYYEVSILNNVSDPGFAAGEDQDGRVILRSVGFGPNNTQVAIEVEVSVTGITSVGGRPCPSYAQRGIAEDGTGRNDCLGSVDSSSVTTMRPGQ